MADINSRLEIGVTTGPIRGSRKVHVGPYKVAMREISLEHGKGDTSENVAEAHAGAPDFVGVGGPDAARRGADGLAARKVREPVVRRDDMRERRDAEPPGARVDAGAREAVELATQAFGIDYAAVADESAALRVEDARRHEVQHELLSVDDQRVTCVRAAAEADRELDARGEMIDDLA